MKRIKTNSIGARILSGVLSVLMIMSACPTTAFAEYDEPEDKTIVVENSDTETENKDAVVVVDGSTEEDENVDSIPVDEDADDQTTPDVDVPPNITTEATEVTTTEEVTTETTTEKATEATTEKTTTEVTTTEKETDTTTETVEEELPVVEFNHYFTEIDESLVETSDLIVTTNDASIFTKNTNVVSNFDNAYIISCDSVEEARYVYSYYVDKVDTITDLSKVISVATDDNDKDIADMSDINDGNDALSNLNDIDVNNYAGYIALIDTGANADVNFSVVGDDTSDSNGHGTKMLNLIKAENPAAKVMSIKVFNGSKTDAASVYAGIKLAIESKVSVINLSLVGSNVEKNAIVKDAINEAIANGITVIGAAGNYNISAKKFIPGCIDDVIVIGAANEDGTKYATSNTDADYYVVAESTSEATAIYTGLYTADKLDDERIFSGNSKDNKDDSTKSDETAGDEWWTKTKWKYVVNEDGSVTFLLDNNFDEFETSTAHREYHGDGTEVNTLSKYQDNTYTSNGECYFNYSDVGEGYISNFTGNSVFETIWKEAGSPAIYSSCDSHWENNTGSHPAPYLTTGTKKYKATSIVSTSSDKTKKYLKVDLMISDDNTYNVNWPTVTLDTKRYYMHITTLTNSNDGVTGNIRGSGHIYDTVTGSIVQGSSVTISKSVTSEGTGGTLVDAANDVRDSLRISIADKLMVIAVDCTDNYGGKMNPSVTLGSVINSSSDLYEQWLTRSYDAADHTQIYRAIFDAYSYNDIYLELTKKYDQDYSDIIAKSNYYKLDGTTIEIYSDKECKNKIIDKNTGKACSFVIPENNGNKAYSKTFKLDYAYAGKTIYFKEVKTGQGYKLDNMVHSTTMEKESNSTTPFTMSNVPMFDPPTLALQKVSNITGKSDFDGSIKAGNAVYTVTQYDLTEANGKGSATGRVWHYKTDSDGIVKFNNKEYCTDTSKAKQPPVNPDDNRLTWPVGYYEITETQVPKGSDKKNYGALQSKHVYSYKIYPCNGQTSLGFNTILFDGSVSNWMERTIRNNTTGLAKWERNPDYKIQIGGVNYTGTDRYVFYAVEEENWLPIGLYKASDSYVVSGWIKNDNWKNMVKRPEGDTSYEGAVYYLYTTDNTIFTPKPANDTANPNGNIYLTAGTSTNQLETVDGLGNSGTTDLGQMLYPVLANGKQVTLVTDSNGIAVSKYKLPESSTYRLVEQTAPEGYKISTKVLTVESPWTKGDKAETIVNFENYINTKNNTATTNAISGSNRKGAQTDTPYSYTITIRKADKYNVTGQGDGTTNDIKFAVINRSADQILVRNTVESDYVLFDTTKTKFIQPGQVAAIITTHTMNNVEGMAKINGLPYGTYQIVELRSDAKISVGENYDDSDKLGSSPLANVSYLWDDSNDSGLVELHDEKMNHNYDFSAVSEDNEKLNINTPFVDGFRAYKMDKTNLKLTEGFSSANDIKFAIVNKSNRQVRLEKKYVDQLGEDAAFVDYKAHEVIAPGEVVAILTTHDKDNIDGYMSIYGLRRNVTMYAG